MTTTTYPMLTLTHVALTPILEHLQVKAPMDLNKTVKRVVGTPATAGELRSKGYHLCPTLPSDAPMVSLFDVERLAKQYLPFRYCSDMCFTNDGYWIFRPSAQFSLYPVWFNREVYGHTAVDNFVDSLDDPELNVIVQCNEILDIATEISDNVYHSNIFIEVPVVAEGVAHFFVKSEYFDGDLDLIFDNNVWDKHRHITRLFEEVAQLELFSGMKTKVILVDGYRKWSEVTLNECLAKLDVIKYKLEEKALKAQKRAQKKYAKEQDRLFNDIPF